MIKPKPKVCPYCKEEYKKFNSFQVCCLKPNCATQWLKDNPEKAKKNYKKVVRKELNQMKEKGMSKSDYMKLAQAAFNNYIRHRDKGLPCVSCNRPLTTKHDAGHFYARGSFPNLRFEELNCHSQCVQCNRDRAGNLLEYREGLIKRIGQEKFDELEAMKRIEKHYSIGEIKEIIQLYRQKIKELK